MIERNPFPESKKAQSAPQGGGRTESATGTIKIPRSLWSEDKTKSASSKSLLPEEALDIPEDRRASPHIFDYNETVSGREVSPAPDESRVGALKGTVYTVAF